MRLFKTAQTISGLFCILIFLPGTHAFAKDWSMIFSPWVLFQHQMQASLGKSTCIHVDDLIKGEHDELTGSEAHRPNGDKDAYTLKVHALCEDDNQGRALASLLTRKHTFGNVVVQVIVFDSKGPIKVDPFPSKVDDAIQWIEAALKGSPFFSKILKNSNPYYSFYIEFKPEIVQFLSDNFEGHQRTNRVAADSHADMLGLRDIRPIRIGIATSIIH